MENTGIISIAHSVQLAVAPVFLLSAVGVTLTVLTNRLSRIIDRARNLEIRLPQAVDERAEAIRVELKKLSRRARLVHHAIRLSTLCALLICLVIVVLFAGALMAVNFAALIAVLFIVALSAFIVGLLCFLMEIHAATENLLFNSKPY